MSCDAFVDTPSLLRAEGGGSEPFNAARIFG